jgi:hypothetical protein
MEQIAAETHAEEELQVKRLERAWALTGWRKDGLYQNSMWGVTVAMEAIED